MRLTPVGITAAACAAIAIVAVGAVSIRERAARAALGDSPVPPSADSVVRTAVRQARAEGKVVLIEFGASWCVWCRHFEAFVRAPDVRDIIANNYVVTNLTVRERDDKVALEHAGGSAQMDAWGGAESGLPFYVFLDAAGRKIADSNAMPGGTNIGFPATPLELETFMKVIDRTAPRLTPEERARVFAYLDATIQRQ